jgi:hypothetical protein
MENQTAKYIYVVKNNTTNKVFGAYTEEVDANQVAYDLGSEQLDIIILQTITNIADPDHGDPAYTEAQINYLKHLEMSKMQSDKYKRVSYNMENIKDVFHPFDVLMVPLDKIFSLSESITKGL